jgi:hypothetical protein
MGSIQHICVKSSANVKQCCNACDTALDAATWKVKLDGETNAVDDNIALQLLVREIQENRNLAVTCPNSEGVSASSQSDWCKLGTRCGGVKKEGAFGSAGSSVRAAKNVPENLGLCILDPAGFAGRTCLNMCDRSLAPEDYPTTGTSIDSVAVINGVRSNECGGVKWWVVLLILLLMCCLCGLVAFLWVRFGHRLKRSRGVNRRTEPVYESLQVPTVQEPTPEFENQREIYQEAVPVVEPPPQPTMVEYQQQPPAQETHYNRIAGLDEPHLAYNPVPVQTVPVQTAPMQMVQTQMPVQQQQQQVVYQQSFAPAYHTTACGGPMQPTGLSQPPLQTAFTTQPLNYAGSMQLAPGQGTFPATPHQYIR